MKNILGVIPARGGSKRLPRKNIKLLDGKPLIEYTIRAASDARSLTDYVFTTDDQEIMKIAKSVGAESVVLRPKELATDHVRNSETMIHALEYMETTTGRIYHSVMLLQPTTPFRTSLHIDEAVKLYNEMNVDSLASVKGPFKKRDINLKYLKNNLLEDMVPSNNEYYIYNAAIYIIKKELLYNTNSFVSEFQCGYPMDQISSIDIDNEFDFVLAQAAFQYLKEKKCPPK